MRLTIRGWSLVAVVLASMGLSWQYGPRALNAVVTPLLVVLVAGLVTTARADRPEVKRTPIAEGSVGEQRSVEIAIESNSTVSATVRDTVGDGLSLVDGGGSVTASDGTDPVLATVLEGDERFSYEIRLAERGEHRLGPLTITVTDVLGLVERRFEYETQPSVVVYPRVHDLRDGAGQALWTLAESITGRDRTAFAHLRQYHHGDTLRDVNWNATAKRPDDDLVVTEYAAEEDVGAVLIAADCPPGWADELATAVATITTALLERRVSVGLAVPGGDYAPGAGDRHRHDLLSQLAVLEAGSLKESQRRQADVVVRADETGTRVSVDDRTIPFDRLTGHNEGERAEYSTQDHAGGSGGSEPGVST
ncbi:DUF58 domain-containing protein [Natronorubrum sulfidifaciens]|uniref:Uncharacterized protein n=1 Tax=Natronorubrum sulfidifaciens JCM 14089 TaxID=1230460 RepID=L9W6R2_9EURY|nr:DUF58 domain-containing protein [Natronorubrum sulfidifaciens]ELY44961.1 hypothetical protein C495_08460 [Natronorubrum sulfidifaciens JCM 14089]